MALPIINGISELTSFNSYIQANSTTYQYGSVAEALQSTDYGTFQVYDGLNASGSISSKVVEFQPDLTGGTKVGADVISFEEVTGGVTGTSGAATLCGVPLIELLGGIFAGLGVGILSYEANKDFWIDISNNLFLNVPGYVPITYNNIEDMSITTLWKDGKTYVDYGLIQQINNYLIELGVFATTEITYDIPPSYGVYTAELAEVSKENILATLHKLHTVAGDNQFYTGQAISELIQAIDFYGIPSNVTFWTMSIQQNQCLVNLQLYTSTGEVNYLYGGNQQIWEWRSGNVQLVRRLWGMSTTGYPEGDPAGLSFGADTTDYGYVPSIGCAQQYSIWTTSSIDASIVIAPDIPELPALSPRTISTTPDSIPTEIPDWWADHMEIGQLDPATETVSPTPYLPISVPSTSPVTNPVTDPQIQIQTGDTPSTNETPIDNSPKVPFGGDSPISSPNEPTPTPTPTPVIPVIPTIGGQANKLFTVYNPTQANLNSLGSVLWSQNIIQQIMQMFTNNPLDAIISLHILYATPTVGSNKEIKLGYVATGVSCPEVTNQYINLNCGTVRVPELFGDVRDYSNTDVTIYLPMIGFRQLKTEDAMASNITVDYKIDVFTGTVLANVIVTRSSTNQVFYTFEGNCAVNLPLTGADKSRQLATAVGVIGSAVTGNPVMGMASATAIAGGSARAQIQRSGNFTGNAGAMGCKKPYILVSSDVPYDAAGYNTQYGYPANLTVMLGTCHGYVKAKEVHADSIANATEKEKREIENQLKQGVIIH